MTSLRVPAHSLLALLAVGLASSCTGPDADQSPKRPSDWHWIQRTYPHYDYDAAALRRVVNERAAASAFVGKSAPNWESLGPYNVAGRIVDIEYNPNNVGEVFIAAATGGIFRSRNGGATWQPVFDDQSALTIGDIAIDPVSPGTLYVGTGEANGGHNNFPGIGIYRSVDGGDTWEFSGLAESASIGRVVVDPQRPNRVLAAAVGSYFVPTPTRGLYLSEDHGESWERTLYVNDSTGVIDVAVNPRNTDTVFAATWERVRRPSGDVYLHGNGSGVWRSTNGAETWQRLSNGLPDPLVHRDGTGRARFGRIGLAIAPSDPNSLYAIYVDGVAGGYFGLYRSDDGGDSWYDADPNDGAENAFSNFSWYFGQIRVAPDDPDRVFVLDQQLAASSDGGTSWSVVTGTHVDHHAMTFLPDGRILNGNDGGLAISSDFGSNWTRLGRLPITQFYEVSLDPANPYRMFGGTQDNGTLESGDGPQDDWSPVWGGDGFYSAIDPTDPNRVYVESQYGAIYRIDATGSTSIKPPQAGATNWSTPFLLHPDDSNTLLYGARRIFRSTNRGSTWTAISPPLGKNTSGRLGTITTIAVSPLDGDVVYAGTDDGNVWSSIDGGESWTNRTNGLVDRWVTRVVPSPYEASVVYLTFSGLKWRDSEAHVFRSSDYGASWLPISGNLPDGPVNAFAVGESSDMLFAGLDIGAYYSLDGGLSWELLGAGLPAVSVYDMKVDRENRRLIAATHGRSMYSLPLAGLVTSIEPHVDGSTFGVSSYPNPATRSSTIRVDAPEPGVATVTVIDALGRRVRGFARQAFAAGAVEFEWDLITDSGTPAAAGVYLAVLHWRGSAGSLDQRTAAATIVVAR